jgi:hypothetical protein
MITLQTFLTGLMAVSTLTGLTTEAVKKILVEQNKTYYANTLAGIVSFIMSIAVGAGYVVLTNISFTNQVVVYMIALVFMSWLCSMIGYDKIIQAINQFKTTKE